MSAFPGIGDTFGRYEIVRRIGRGGMGSVFEARQVDLGRAVALKVLSPELAEDRDFRARFVREANTLAALDSPHVIQVFDSGEYQGDLFIATQLIHGRDLLQLLREDGPMSAPMALKVVGQVASALADAHDAGVLHRDVKPGNVLLRESQSDAFAYLCDFGIARHRDSSYTRTTGVVGTLSYLAPECHEGSDASVASDIYSLGCVLWAVLTGRAPFERTSEFQIALAHVQEKIPTYSGDSPASTAINTILQRAMAKDPSARFRDAGEMHAALLAAEETARGLQDEFDRTSVRGPSTVSDPTRRRPVPAPAPLPPPGQASGQGTPSVAGSTGGRQHPPATKVLASAAVAVLLLAGGITAVKLLGSEKAEASGSQDDARNAMKSVFPSVDTCKEVDPNPTNDEDEVFECVDGDSVIRYARWASQDSAEEYLTNNYRGGGPTEWFVGGTLAGSMWSATAQKKDPDLPYVWAAVYGDHPYVVIVKATDTQAREAARTRVEAVTPDRVDED